MKNEDRVAANELANEIDIYKARLKSILANGGVNIAIQHGGWLLDKILPQSTLDIARTIVEADLKASLKKLEDKLEQL